MPHRSVRLLAQGAAALAVAAGSVGVAHADKSVAMTVDGQPTTVHVFGSTVEDVLDKKGIEVGAHDVVVPSPETEISDGDRVSVRFGRKLVVTVDGEKKEYWTTATTVGDALADIGIRGEGAVLSASRSQPLGRGGLEMAVTMPKDVTVTVGGKKQKVSTVAADVRGVLTQLDVTKKKNDILKPGFSAEVTDGMKITLKRVTTKTKTTTEAVAYETTTRKDSSMPEGTSKTVTAGRKGTKEIVTRHTYVDGKRDRSKVLETTITKKPVTKIVAVGTKAPEPAAPSTSSAPARSAGNTSGAGLNLANAAMWDRIAQCESSGNWSINTGNGYYGGLQFNSATWLSVGGDDFAPRADLASRAEQITVANRLYAQRGLQPWGCAHAA